MGKPFNLPLIVTGKNDAAPCQQLKFDELFDQRRRLWIKGRCGFIQQQHPRFVDEGSGKCQSLAFTG